MRFFAPQYDNSDNRLQIADGRWWVVENRRPLKRDPSTPLRVTKRVLCDKKAVILSLSKNLKNQLLRYSLKEQYDKLRECDGSRAPPLSFRGMELLEKAFWFMKKLFFN